MKKRSNPYASFCGLNLFAVLGAFFSVACSPLADQGLFSSARNTDESFQSKESPDFVAQSSSCGSVVPLDPSDARASEINLLVCADTTSNKDKQRVVDVFVTRVPELFKAEKVVKFHTSDEAGWRAIFLDGLIGFSTLSDYEEQLASEAYTNIVANSVQSAGRNGSVNASLLDNHKRACEGLTTEPEKSQCEARRIGIPEKIYIYDRTQIREVTTVKGEKLDENNRVVSCEGKTGDALAACQEEIAKTYTSVNRYFSRQGVLSILNASGTPIPIFDNSPGLLGKMMLLVDLVSLGTWFVKIKEFIEFQKTEFTSVWTFPKPLASCSVNTSMTLEKGIIMFTGAPKLSVGATPYECRYVPVLSAIVREGLDSFRASSPSLINEAGEVTAQSFELLPSKVHADFHYIKTKKGLFTYEKGGYVMPVLREDEYLDEWDTFAPENQKNVTGMVTYQTENLANRKEEAVLVNYTMTDEAGRFTNNLDLVFATKKLISLPGRPAIWDFERRIIRTHKNFDLHNLQDLFFDPITNIGVLNANDTADKLSRKFIDPEFFSKETTKAPEELITPMVCTSLPKSKTDGYCGLPIYGKIQNEKGEWVQDKNNVLELVGSQSYGLVAIFHKIDPQTKIRTLSVKPFFAASCSPACGGENEVVSAGPAIPSNKPDIFYTVTNAGIYRIQLNGFELSGVPQNYAKDFEKYGFDTTGLKFTDLKSYTNGEPATIENKDDPENPISVPNPNFETVYLITTDPGLIVFNSAIGVRHCKNLRRVLIVNKEPVADERRGEFTGIYSFLPNYLLGNDNKSPDNSMYKVAFSLRYFGSDNKVSTFGMYTSPVNLFKYFKGVVTAMDSGMGVLLSEPVAVATGLIPAASPAEAGVENYYSVEDGEKISISAVSTPYDPKNDAFVNCEGGA